MSNVLNINIIHKKKEKSNNVNINKLLHNIKSNMNNDFNKMTYLGKGIEGDIYKVKSINGKYYICKCFSNNMKIRSQVNQELSILRMLQEHKLSKNYIYPCYGSNIDSSYILCLFPNFKCVNLQKILDTIYDSSFKKSHRNILLKYIIKEVLFGLHMLHSRKICHMNLDKESILVETNELYDEDLKNNKDSSIFEREKNTNIDNNKNTVEPTNKHIYKPYFDSSDKLLQVKFTNLGNSYGKVIKTNIKEAFNNESNKPIKKSKSKYNFLFNKEKFLEAIEKDKSLKKYYLKNKSKMSKSKLLKLGQLYDIYMLGRLILFLIIKKEIKEEYEKVSLSSIDENELIDSSFEPYLEMLKKYMLVPLNNRKKLKFIRDMIIVREKY